VNAAGSNFTYDAAGNVTYDGKNSYAYDGEGRICAVASTPVPGMTAMTGYLYDADGARVAKGRISAWSCDPGVNGFQTTSDYILGPGGEQVTEMGMDANNSMAWQHTNVYAAGKLLATYDNDGLHFYFNDPLGTRRAQTDYAGVLEQTCSSLPFGDGLNCITPPNSSGNSYAASLIAPTEHHFTGKERDTESGNDYFGARYYSSSMGRFLSPDWAAKVMPVPYVKLDNPQTFNLYAYVGNNPLTRTDPTGHVVCNGSECDQVKKSLDDTKKAIASGTLSKDEKNALKGVLKFYGKWGQDNGVTVNTGVKGLTTEGGVGNTVTENGKTTISLNLGALDKTVNQGSPEVEKAATVVHEGEHGVQQQANGMPTTPEQRYAAEQQAYTVQSYVNKGLNSDSDRNLWTSSGGFNQNAVNENAADATRLGIHDNTWRSPDE